MDVEQIIQLVDDQVYIKSGHYLSDLQKQLLLISLSEPRKRYEEIAQSCGYSVSYLKRDAGPKLWQLLSDICEEKVKKTNFRTILEKKIKILEQKKLDNNLNLSFSPQSSEVTCNDVNNAKENINYCYNTQKDWGTAPDVSYFVGRESELTQLQTWIVQDKCRCVGIVGMGGMGKTYLSVKLGENIEHDFEYVIWRSLSNATLLSDLLSDILQFFTQQEKDLVINIDEQISRLINFCSQHRCLIILDNLETILATGVNSGYFQTDFQDYIKLFQKLGECRHKSCLLITSREKIKEMVLMCGDTLPVRCFNLGGLNTQAGLEILKIKGCYWSNYAQANQLIENYNGNPLTLKILGATIKELFDGSLSEFIKNKVFIFDEIICLLEEHFQRLSDLGKKILYWLAINIDEVTTSDLERDIYPTISRLHLITALKSLMGRSLIECHDNRFSLQPVVKEYLINKLIQEIINEIITEELDLFNHYALLKTDIKEHTRKSQVNFIVRPLLDKLIIIFKNQYHLESKLRKIVQKLQEENLTGSGYAVGNILNLLCELNTDLSGWDFSKLTIRQAYLQECKLHNVNFAHCEFQQSVFPQRLSNILSMVYSPNDQFLVTGDVNGEICVWSLQENRLISIFKGHAGWVHGVAFSPDGKYLASGSSDQTIKIWDVSTGKCLNTLFGHNQRVRCVIFTPDSQKLISGGSDCSIKIWDFDSGICLQTLNGHNSYVWSVVISPDGKYLASGSEDKSIKIWQLDTGKCLRTLKGHTLWIRTLAFSGDGTILASGGGDRIIKIWDWQTGKCLKELHGHTQRIRSLAFHPEDNILASGAGDHTIRLWDWQQGTCRKTLHGHNSRLGAIAFRGDGQILASGGEDNAIKLWETGTGQCVKTWQGYASWIQAVTFSPDGNTLACGNEDKLIKLWNVSNLTTNGTNTQTFTSLHGHKGWVCSVAFSPDGKILASASSDYSLKIWDMVTGKCLKTLVGHNRWIRSVAFSPDGKKIASASGDYSLKIWDMVTGKCLKTLRSHQSWLWSVAFSPDGKILASGSEDRTVKIWDTETGKCLHTLEGHQSWVQSVVFSPDGKYIASGSCDYTIRLWKVKTGECVKTLIGHYSWVQSVAFSPDGEYLASGSCDHTIRLWNAKTGDFLRILRGHNSWVWSVSFHPNSKYLASGSQDETVKIWNVETGKCIMALRGKRPFEDSCFIGIKGLTIPEMITLENLGAQVTL
ncbi:pentapeptide repeat-containing protein [Cyanobacterium aponinum FACHB-4101]|uniref:WD40 domain-containing protein n=1 Tax=Cyanobacterium aponinum TaxID=379064 RepID=UPI001680BA89|nr:NB-ARC domain-containing protein [Cyanobacterium aponinum]MBD2394813.1 pentapeptide repeat-containing protein [Cyanobacterium aponinum FACHB-4101]